MRNLFIIILLSVLRLETRKRVSYLLSVQCSHYCRYLFLPTVSSPAQCVRGSLNGRSTPYVPSIQKRNSLIGKTIIYCKVKKITKQLFSFNITLKCIIVCIHFEFCWNLNNTFNLLIQLRKVRVLKRFRVNFLLKYSVFTVVYFCYSYQVL